MCEHQEKQDPRRGAHPHQAATLASYSTSLSTFPHCKQRVKHINTQNSSVHGGGNENPPFLPPPQGLLVNKNESKNQKVGRCMSPLVPVSKSVSERRRLSCEKREVVEITTGSLHSCQRHRCFATELCFPLRALSPSPLSVYAEREKCHRPLATTLDSLFLPFSFTLPLYLLY